MINANPEPAEESSPLSRHPIFFPGLLRAQNPLRWNSSAAADPLADFLPLALALSEATRVPAPARPHHRDLKPSNIIFIESVPKLADIGVGHGDGGSPSSALKVSFRPERSGTAQADIFSLGKLFYECGPAKTAQLPRLAQRPGRHSRPRGLPETERNHPQSLRKRHPKTLQTAEQLSADLLASKQAEPLPDAAKSWFHPMQWINKGRALFGRLGSDPPPRPRTSRARPIGNPGFSGGILPLRPAAESCKPFWTSATASKEFQRTHRIGLLTLLFTDMVGSTKLKQQLRRAAVAMMQRHHELVRQILHRFPKASRSAPGRLVLPRLRQAIRRRSVFR